MIEPIVLNKHGEELKGYPGSEAGDEGSLSNCVGIHSCGGWMDGY